MICGSIRCCKCGLLIKKNYYETIENKNDTESERLERECRRIHDESEHVLRLWGTIKAADDTGACMISLEHK